MQSIFLNSKITAPKSPLNLIERKQIDSLLQEHIEKKLIVFRAPAGYGKTTLISSWLKKTKETTVWISLDESDNNSISFWSYVLTALHQAIDLPDYEQLLELVKTKDSAGLKLFIYSLIETLAAFEKPIHIVWDDFHFIENQTIEKLFILFVDYLPANVHLYITTRNRLPLPTAKWHVKQWLYELPLEQLQFTRNEIQQFFIQVAHWHLNEDELTRVMQNTEGWVSGLLLTTLSSEHKKIDQQATSLINDFLWHEIVMQQPEEIQLFLLKTSFLHELNPTICDELTGSNQSAAILKQLVEKGLFIVKLDEEKSTYRYHHLLIATLQKEFYKRFNMSETADFMHRLAWLHYKNEQYLLGIHYALNNGDYDIAVEWIDEHLVLLISSGHDEQLLQWIRHLLDVDYPIKTSLLLLSFIQSVSLFELTLAERLMAICEKRLEEEKWKDDPEQRYYFVNFTQTKAYLLVCIGDRLPEVFTLIKSQLNIPYVSKEKVGLKLAYHTYEMNLLRTSLASRGRIISVEDAHEVVRLFEETELDQQVVAVYLYGTAAATFYEQNDLVSAEKMADRIIQRTLAMNLPNVYIPLYILKAKIYCARKQYTTAQHLLQPLIQHSSGKHWHNALQAMSAKCYVQMGELKNAAFLLSEPNYYTFEQLIYCQFLIQRQQYDEAITLLTKVKDTAQEELQLATTIEASILETIAYDQSGNRSYALHLLHQILPVVARYNYIRSFLDHAPIQHVLEAYLREKPFNIEESDVSFVHAKLLLTHFMNAVQENKCVPNLTAREKEIYQLILDGATNKEIAKTLFLSEGTVRVYISALYQKIEVRSRAQAIKKASLYKDLLQP